MQLAGGDESIAPIIALAADHAHGIEIKVPLGKFRHCAACILHQCERWNAVLLRGKAVDLTHFGGGNDLHVRVPYEDEEDGVPEDCPARFSSLASCCGSPMAMR